MYLFWYNLHGLLYCVLNLLFIMPASNSYSFFLRLHTCFGQFGMKMKASHKVICLSMLQTFKVSAGHNALGLFTEDKSSSYL